MIWCGALKPIGMAGFPGSCSQSCSGPAGRACFTRPGAQPQPGAGASRGAQEAPRTPTAAYRAHNDNGDAPALHRQALPSHLDAAGDPACNRIQTSLQPCKPTLQPLSNQLAAAWYLSMPVTVGTQPVATGIRACVTTRHHLVTSRQVGPRRWRCACVS